MYQLEKFLLPLPLPYEHACIQHSSYRKRIGWRHNTVEEAVEDNSPRKRSDDRVVRSCVSSCGQRSYVSPMSHCRHTSHIADICHTLQTYVTHWSHPHIGPTHMHQPTPCMCTHVTPASTLACATKSACRMTGSPCSTQVAPTCWVRHWVQR